MHAIVKKDVGLKCFKKRQVTAEFTEDNRHARLEHSRQPLDLHSPSGSHDKFTWFTDEKLFATATLRNSQNDRLYAATGTLKKNISADRLLLTRLTFSGQSWFQLVYRLLVKRKSV